jgi:pantetheine-phosphate adenylyltransferase
MPRTAFYPGSFDPPTLGHADVLARARRLADRVVVGIGVHPGKAPMFAADERAALLKAVVALDTASGLAPVEVVTFDDLTVTAAARVGATLLVRGLRDGTDFDYEMQLAGTNAAMAPGITTVFLPASPGVRHITGTLVRQIARMGGDVSALVPAPVFKALTGRS